LSERKNTDKKVAKNHEKVYKGSEGFFKTIKMTNEKEPSIGELATIVNNLEEIQLEEEFSPCLDGKIKLWVDILNKYADKLIAYVGDIRDCLRGLAEFYRIHDEAPPKFSAVYQV